MITFSDLKFDNVLHIYSGERGACCCGCKGKHRYNPNFRDTVGKQRGYEVRDEELVTKRAVTRLLNTFQRNHNSVEELEKGKYTLDVDGRTYLLTLV